MDALVLPVVLTVIGGAIVLLIGWTARTPVEREPGGGNPRKLASKSPSRWRA